MLYEKPWGYAAFHVAIGFVAAWVPWVGVVAVAYQFLQWWFQIRVFAWEGEIRSGNSWQHTGVKLTEMMVGFIAGVASRTTWGSGSATPVV